MEGKPQQPAKGRILVVDDEEAVVTLLAAWLADGGYFVRSARCFDDVQRVMAAEPFDLVTLDIMMPEVDGLQILQWLGEHCPDVGVIMATAMEDTRHVLEAMRAGAINYLVKPFDMELVTEQVQRGLERQRLIAENRAYQQELERKVEERTRALQEAHALLQRQVRELEGRDRLVQLQMSPPADAREADAETLRIVAEAMDESRVALYRPDAGGAYLESTAALGVASSGYLDDQPEPGATENLRLDTGEAGAAGPGHPAPVAAPDGGPPVPVSATDHLVAQVFRDRQAAVGADGEVAVPVLYNTEVMGVLQVLGPPDQDRDAALTTLGNLAREIALVWRIMQMADDLEAGSGAMAELLQQEAQAASAALEWEE